VFSVHASHSKGFQAGFYFSLSFFTFFLESIDLALS
jgi:hypothetical protein